MVDLWQYLIAQHPKYRGRAPGYDPPVTMPETGSFGPEDIIREKNRQAIQEMMGKRRK
jgi:hypothetical protein